MHPQRAPAHDPWAHRRGEPRVFAFLWSLYVFAAVVGSIAWTAGSSSGGDPSFSPAARSLLVILVAGVTLIWPMCRLSQAAPRSHHLSYAMADVLVVLLPVQMVIWPLWFLAAWPADIVAAIAALLAVWALLIGGMLAWATGPSRVPGARRRPVVWMGVIALLSLAIPLWSLVGGTFLHAAGVRWPYMLSPFTAIAEIAGSGWSGPSGRVVPMQWMVLVLLGTASLGVWGLAGIAGFSGGSRGRGVYGTGIH